MCRYSLRILIIVIILDEECYSTGSFRIRSKLQDKLVRRSTDNGLECLNKGLSSKVVSFRNKVVDKEKKKKTVIISKNYSKENDKRKYLTADSRFEFSVKPIKKTIDPKVSLSNLIAAMKSKALSSFLGTLSNNAKGLARKSSDIRSSSQESTKSKLESLLAGEKKDEAAKEEKGKTEKVVDAGKSILAAIDDKEGLRAALAKAIDRVEKVVANKNGLASTRLAGKLEEINASNSTKAGKDELEGIIASKTKESKNSETEDIDGKNEKQDLTKLVTQKNNTNSERNRKEENKYTLDNNNNNTTIPTDDSNVTLSKSANEGLSTIENITTSEKKNSTTNAPPQSELDPYAEIAMGPDKPKIPELKGEDDSAAAQTGAIKLGATNPSGNIGDGGGDSGEGGTTASSQTAHSKPLAGMHDVGGLLDSLTDKVNLADTKGISPAAGLPDQVSTLLDRAQDKFNQMDNKGGDQPPVLPDQLSSMLSNAADKFNQIGPEVNSDAPGGNNNVDEVKFMQPQRQSGGDLPMNNKLLETKVNGIRPSKDPYRPLNPDEAIKALEGAESIAGADSTGGDSTPDEEMKSEEKEELMSNIMKQQGTASDEDGSLKSLNHMKETSQIKDDENEGDEERPRGNHKIDDESSSLISKEPEPSENLVKDILNKADTMNGRPESPSDNLKDFQKDFQGADITAGPDPYEGDKSSDSYGQMLGSRGISKNNEGNAFDDMPNSDDPEVASHSFSPHTVGEDSFNEEYEKQGDGNRPRTGYEPNDDNQIPGREIGGREMEPFVNMANINDLGNGLGNDLGFSTRHTIPRYSWRVPATKTGTALLGDNYHDTYNTQVFKKKVIIRPRIDSYVSPFKNKASFDVDQ